MSWFGWFLFAFVFYMLLYYGMYAHAVNSYLAISPAEARARLAKGEFDVVIDVRTKSEWSSSKRYPYAIHAPLNLAKKEVEFATGTAPPPKSARILLYCRTGNRARLAAEDLVLRGYKNVRYLVGDVAGLL